MKKGRKKMKVNQQVKGKMHANERRRSECASRKYKGIFEEEKKNLYKILRE